MGRKSKLKRERRELGFLGIPANRFKGIRKARTNQEHPRMKMSEALLELVEPFMDEIEDLEGFKNLVSLASLGWSLSLLDDHSAMAALRDFQEIDSPDSDFCQWFVALLAVRKQLLFSDDHRMILDWEATVRPDGSYYLQVASSWCE